MNAVLLPVYLTAAGLLVASAVAKLRDPGPAAEALTELRLPAGRLVVRAAALVELCAATLMVAVPAVGAPLGCALYLVFAIIVLAQLRQGGTRSCGCLGSARMPPTRLHAAVNVLLAVCCAAVRPDPLAGFDHPLSSGVVWLSAATAAWAVAAGLELLPPAIRAYRRPGA